MIDLTEVKGIGPATAVKLHGAGVSNAEQLARSEIDHIASIVGSATGKKIVENARALLDEKGIDYSTPSPKRETKRKKEKDKMKKDPEIISDLEKLPGIGPKTKETLKSSGFPTVSDIAAASIGQLEEVQGVGKATASKIREAAMDLLGVDREEIIEAIEPKEEPVEEFEEAVEPKEIIKEEPEEVFEDTPEVRTEHERSPAPQGIPTKKKRGVQISSTEIEKIDLDELDREKEPAGWQVKARELTEEEREARRIRQERMAMANRITREIPKPPKPIKAKKVDKEAKTEKPVKKKKIRQVEDVKEELKKVKEEKNYFSNQDLYPPETDARQRSAISDIEGKSKPRIELDRDTYLGKITSKRRSRRNINHRQAIVKLEDGFEPDQLVGLKIYFEYPEGTKLSGRVSRRFAKKSTGKILVQFKKGLREEAIFREVYTY